MKALEVAIQVGVKPAEFWEMTPFELSLVVKSFTESMKRDMDNQISLAWLNAYLQRVDKMPPLSKFVKDKPVEKKPQKPENMLAVVKALNAKFGGNTY